MSAFTLTDWNALIQAANIKRQQAIASNCIVPGGPLEEVIDPHVFLKYDIESMQNFLRILCDNGSFSEVTDHWSQTIIDEIADHILNVEACNCVECDTVSYQPTTTPVYIISPGTISVIKRNSGICNVFSSNVKFKRSWIDAYDELYQYQLFPNWDPSERTWELKLEFDAWEPSFLCTILPAQSLMIASGPVLQDGTIHAFPSGSITDNLAIISVNNRYDSQDHYPIRPYTYTLYGYCEE